jgi:CheY-like chemotaxis protein
MVHLEPLSCAGSVFLYTPADADHAGPAGGVGGPVRVILVVDDDDAIRDSLTFVLEDEGYRVHTAADGRDALAVLARIPCPALALVDLRMPVMDGVELIAAMRGDARLATVPILVLSAASTIAVPAGIPTLPKPSSVERILDAVERHRAD